MVEDQVRKLRFQIGDMMGDYAPEYFRPRRSSTTMEFLIGAGSVLTAFGIGYLAMRLADRRLGEIMERLVPAYASDRMKRHTVHGTHGAEMPDADRMERRERMERTTVQSGNGSDWPRPEERSSI